VTLSGKLTCTVSEDYRKSRGFAGGTVGTIVLKLLPKGSSNPREADFEVSFQFTIVEVPDYLNKDVDHIGSASFKGMGVRIGENKWHFTGRGPYVMKSAYYSKEQKAGYQSWSSDAVVQFDVLPDASVKGIVAGISPWGQFDFTAQVPKAQ
jgi:hypothetical protein